MNLAVFQSGRTAVTSHAISADFLKLKPKDFLSYFREADGAWALAERLASEITGVWDQGARLTCTLSHKVRPRSRETSGHEVYAAGRALCCAGDRRGGEAELAWTRHRGAGLDP